MGRKTVAVVVPVVKTRKGGLAAGEPVTCQSADHARRQAVRTASRCAGAVAFTRSGDPELDEYDDPVLLEVHGQVPAQILTQIVPMPF